MRAAAMLRAMSYVLHGLEPALFEPLFQLDDEALAARGMRWMNVDEPVGERVLLLLPFVHQQSHSPYRASGPIFVRRGAGAAPLIERYLARDDVSYLHLHFARRGCYACRADRS